MVGVEIQLSMATINKIKLLQFHLNEDETVDGVVSDIIEPYLVSKIDLLIAKRLPRDVLLEALGMTEKTAAAQVVVDFDEDIADLGDGDTEEYPPSEPAPVKGGLTDAVLKQDMEVDDPEHEAKSDALKVDLSSPEDFAEAIGMLDPRVARRKKRFTPGKGRVTPMTTDRVEESF